MASSVWTSLVDLRTLGRIANPLQNRRFPSIRFSDNEHSKLDIWDSGGILLCGHRVVGRKIGEGDDQRLVSAGTLYDNPVQTSADCCGNMP